MFSTILLSVRLGAEVQEHGGGVGGGGVGGASRGRGSGLSVKRTGWTEGSTAKGCPPQCWLAAATESCLQWMLRFLK